MGGDQFWVLPEYPHTRYNRTFEAPVDADAHLYEFVVPWPPRNVEREGARRGVHRADGAGNGFHNGGDLHADVCEPAAGMPIDQFQHWGLTHFLLDGHHKLEAAAAAGRQVRLLSLLALGESLAGADDCARLPALRTRPRAARATGT